MTPALVKRLPVDPAVHIHDADLPDVVVHAAATSPLIGWDIETTGLDWQRDEICLVQLFIPDTGVHLVRPGVTPPDNLLKLLADPKTQKLFHYALFDLKFMAHRWGCTVRNMVCTKVASKILSPERSEHSLKSLLQSYLNIEIDK